MLATLPGLTSVTVELSTHQRSNPLLGPLHGLSALTVTGACSRLHTMSQLRMVIRRSPKLEYLKFGARSFMHAGMTVPNLRDILSDTGATPVLLKHIGLGWAFLRVDAQTLPHIRTLTSLTW